MILKILKQIFAGTGQEVCAMHFCAECMAQQINRAIKTGGPIHHVASKVDESCFTLYDAQEKFISHIENSNLIYSTLKIEADSENLIFHFKFRCESCRKRMSIPVLIDWLDIDCNDEEEPL